MKKFGAHLRLPILISLLLVLPLMTMELINRRNFNEGFPFVLFLVLFFVTFSFTLLLILIIKNIRIGNKINITPVLFIQVGFLILIGVFGIMILIDQMPCFLGVPNCD